MSVWWDVDAGRYRSTLVHKILLYGWPAIRFIMVRLPSETAQHLAIRGIQATWWVDRIWRLIMVACAVTVLLLIRALVRLPWFTCDPEDPRDRV